MSYCEQHLRKEKGSLAGEIILIVFGVVLALFGALIIAAMIYALQWGNVGFGMAIGIILVAIGVALIAYAIKRRKKRHAVEVDVEQSELVRSIRSLMPPEYAGSAVSSLFHLVDQDLAKGKHFSRADIGREWILIGQKAYRAEHILGIFLYKNTHVSSSVISYTYEIWVYDKRFQGTNLVFPSKGEAQSCYQALTDAAPGAQCGGRKEESAFLKEMAALKDTKN